MMRAWAVRFGYDRDPLSGVCRSHSKALSMNRAGPILSYGLPRATTALALVESDNQVRVVFPVNPEWMHVLSIVMPVAYAVYLAGIGVEIVRMLCHSFKLPALAAVSIMRTSLIELVVAATLCGGYGAYDWWKFIRWGRVPRVLTADEKGLTLSQLGWLRMSEKRWSRHQVIAIELRPVKGNLSRRRTVADLYVRRSSGWRLHFRLSSKDPALPRRIAETLSGALGCPLRA